jgi:hypothetical protein
MTAFITHCWRRKQSDLIGLLACVCLVWGPAFPARAEPLVPAISALHLERAGDAVLLTATVNFELSAAVQDALLKGVAIIFVAETQVLRERWYWTNKEVARVERHMRLAYQPLTRRWRLNVGANVATNTGLGMALNQNFESMADALAIVQRFSGWKIADIADIDLAQPHRVVLHFHLDASQLPRPLQIGTLGQSDWSISVTSSQPLVLDDDK